MEIKSVGCTVTAWWFYNDWPHGSEYPRSCPLPQEAWLSAEQQHWFPVYVVLGTAFACSHLQPIAFLIVQMFVCLLTLGIYVFDHVLPFPSLPGNPLWVGCVRKHRLISIFILSMLTKEEAECWGVSRHCWGLSISMKKQEEEGAGYTSVLSL